MIDTNADNEIAPASGGLRALTRRVARRAGVEHGAVTAYETLLELLQSPRARRNRRDDEQARLLAAAVLRPDSNCVDVGANEGNLLRLFTELAPRGTHIAYEPVPHLQESLRRRFPKAEVHGTAVSNRSGESSFVVHKLLPSRSSLRPVGVRAADAEIITVRVEALDQSLPPGYVTDLLKVDVEGAEHLVLEGARETLRTHRPVVLFEHQRSTAQHYGSGPEHIFGLLVDELAMRIFDLDGGGPYSLAAMQRVYDRDRRWNFFAVPTSPRTGSSDPW